MREISDKVRIQIELTNACKFSCTNCYKFVGHHNKPQFMDLNTAKRAIDSLDGFQGQIGITGGEPTLHPNFTEICDYLREKIPPDQRYLQTTGHKWKDYKSLIKKTFGDRVSYNDHKDSTQKHHPMLVAIKDVVKDSALRRELINKCWVREKWSAMISSRGCFSCEIAGAFDALYNGSEGLPVEKGWWKKGHEHFNSQMERYCNQCGAALPLPAVSISSYEDFISISNYERIVKKNANKFKNNRVFLYKNNMSRLDVENIAATWEPWENHGNTDPRKNALQHYGKMGSFILKCRRKLRSMSGEFKKFEKNVSLSMWHLLRVKNSVVRSVYRSKCFPFFKLKNQCH